MKRILSLLMAFVMVVSFLPSAAAAGDPAAVAKIGETEYPTLDDAVTAAEDHAVIEILGNCTTEAGLNLSKDLTIQAAEDLPEKPTITFAKYGIALWGKSVTFKNCNIEMNGVGSTPYYQEWSWMSVCGQAGSAINLVNVDMTMDGQGQNKHAIYADNGMKLSLDKSNLVIQNYGQDALEWNGGTFDYNVELIDSTYTSDHNRSGFTGSFNVKAADSRVEVINSTGNGSNGSNFCFTDSVVNFSDNSAHGLSANRLEAVNTPITANNNGRWGIVANRAAFTDCKGPSRIQANHNGYEGLRVAYAKSFASSPSTFDVVNSDLECIHNGYWKPDDIWNGVQLKNVIGKIDKNSTLTIKESPNTGLLIKGNSSVVTIEEGADVTITENNSGYINGGGQGIGGGVRVEASCELTLPSDAKIYNNHAELAGDDIYCAEGGKITFGKVGSTWYLDGSENEYLPGAANCTDQIDGWYDDAKDNRWSAHTAPLYMKEFVPTAAPVNGPLALKAAHGSEYVPPVEPDPDPEAPEHEWEHSKSKTATNLDKNFESQVTLALPSAEEELISDVVFVLDESSCGKPVRDEVSKMLNDLYAHIQNTNAKIKVGAVQFRGVNKELPLTELNSETADTVATFMLIPPFVGGSNMHAGLLAGEKMLDADTEVDDSRKYLILVSDGIAYIWDKDDDSSTTKDNMGINFSNADTPDKPFLASPDGWDVKYGNSFVPDNWDTHMSEVTQLMDKTIAEKSSAYVRRMDISQNPFVKPDEQESYVSTVDIALYKSMEVYNRIASKYNAFSVMTGVENEMTYYPYGPSFMEYLSNGEDVSFDSIEKEIYYLLDAGSKVKDVIGYGKDNEGNDYNMDFVNDASKLSIKVGDEVLQAEKLEQKVLGNFEDVANETSAYGFGQKDGAYRFVLHYFAKGIDAKSDECFVWDINEAVSNFAPVQLTYTVRLTNPQKDTSTYGKFDANGVKGYDGLYTNESAVLYPEDSNGEYGEPEAFAKPTVSYTVESSGGGGGGDDKPVLNTKDHYSYIIGYKDGNVRPYGLITRGEVATIFFRLLTDEARDKYWSQESGYADCSRELWCNNAISTLTNMGIIDGYKDGNFYPYHPITRAQFAKMAVGFFDTTVEEYKGYFTDVAPDAWYTEYIEAAVRAGLIKGFVDGSYRPNVNITRAQACVIVNRALDRHPHEDHLLPAHKMITWPDSNPGDWYYADMQEATNSHDYHMTSSEEKDPETGKWIKVEDWTKKLPQRDWAAFEHAWADAHSAPFEGEVVVSRPGKR